MSIESSVQLFAAINFLVIGFSHIFAPRAWVGFFALLRQKGEPGVFAVAFLTLVFGSIVAAFHNVWSGLPAVLTVVGWGQVLKALIYFAFPSFGLRRIGMVPPERAQLFVYGGFVSLGLGAFLLYLFATS
jgi:hypothetical protein